MERISDGSRRHVGFQTLPWTVDLRRGILTWSIRLQGIPWAVDLWRGCHVWSHWSSRFFDHHGLHDLIMDCTTSGSTWGRQSNTITPTAASGSSSVRRGAIRVGVSLTRGMRRRAKTYIWTVSDNCPQPPANPPLPNNQAPAIPFGQTEPQAGAAWRATGTCSSCGMRHVAHPSYAPGSDVPATGRYN